MRLYTYLPKDNTAATDGLLSTALSDKGFEKYRSRTGKYKKEDVLKVLDSWEPDWIRSRAVSALSQPIPVDAAPLFKEFADSHELYSFDTKDLLKAKILKHIRKTKRRRGTVEISEPEKDKFDWSKSPGKLLFSGVPHYMVETMDGRIPSKLIRRES